MSIQQQEKSLCRTWLNELLTSRQAVRPLLPPVSWQVGRNDTAVMKSEHRLHGDTSLRTGVNSDLSPGVMRASLTQTAHTPTVFVLHLFCGDHFLSAVALCWDVWFHHTVFCHLSLFHNSSCQVLQVALLLVFVLFVCLMFTLHLCLTNSSDLDIYCVELPFSVFHVCSDVA